VDNLAGQLAADIFSRIEETTNSHLRDSRLIAETVRVAAKAGQLDTSDFAALERYFYHLTQVTPAAPYIYFGNLRGDFIGVDRGFGGGVTTRIKNEGTAGTRYAYRIGAPGDRNQPIPEQSGPFDTLARPWYRQAMQTGTAGWTPIYLSPVKRVLEMTQAVPIADGHGKIVGALGVDVSLGYLSQFMRGLTVSPHGVAFLMEPSGELVATSNNGDPFIKTRLAERRVLAAASADPLVRETAVRLLDPAQSRLEPGKSSAFNFQGKDGPVQVVAQQLGNGSGLHWIVAVAIPRGDLTADTKSGAYRTLAICLLVLGLMLAFGLFILRHIRGDIGQLTRAAENLGGGEWSQPLPTERKDEIGKLARAFAAMSEKLHCSNIDI
jgi:HAMP domain-containing protein